MSLKIKPKPLLARPETRVPIATRRRSPHLENGDRLTATEFLRRYEAAADLKKAQLIEGIVHMPSPVRANAHSEPDGLLHGWLFSYALEHPDLKFYPNATLVLDPDNAPQPDAALCSAPHPGGKVWLNEKGYLCGAPELVCEIAASSVSVDLHDKFRAYRRNGIAEYLVWLTEEERVCWFELADQEYVEKEPKAGKLASSIFPGLVLDVKALLKMDRAKLIGTLRSAMSGK
ncbi:MAG TPA: Uma2 family endonuclease [Verrucomicrobiales bacterium]|jgi:Uma2 family endonuclease|nr:Uma2 family endonuclease [Verrucomicrobiales bacterium]